MVFIFKNLWKVNLLNTKRALYMLCAVQMLSACSISPVSNEVTVVFDPDTRLQYKGNSAAMMSMIGSEGIAIGMAIDEGIAKDLEANVAAQGGSKALLTRCFIQESKLRATEKFSEISIHRIDIVPQDDGFYAVLSGTKTAKDQQHKFSFGKREWGITTNLHSLRLEPSLTVQLLTNVCEGTWQQLSITLPN